MNGYKKYFVFVSILILGFSIYGCSDAKNTQGYVAIIDKPISVIANNDQIKQFNQKLGEIKDRKTAENAVNAFVDYVGSRVKISGVGAQSVRAFMTPSFISEVVCRELLARKIEIDAVPTTDDETGIKPLIDVGTITDTVNQLGNDQGVRVDDDMVSSAKAAVEGSIPNLNPGLAQGMTPLNAMVVGYALVSNDDGTASPESVALLTNKINTFMNIVTQ